MAMLFELGDCPNIDMPTVGGKFFWQSLDTKAGMELQKHILTDHCRILDVTTDTRVAWGSEPVMREKFQRLTGEYFLQPGDIIGVTRKHAMGLYDHYAVYIGDGQVIHYHFEDAGNRRFSSRVTIHQAPMSEFMKKEENCFVLFFEDDRHAPKKIFRKSEILKADSVYTNQLLYNGSRKFELYTAEETINRAKSRVGEDAYNLILNNCEHFALWCKTGVSTSFQVKRIVFSLAELKDSDEWTKHINKPVFVPRTYL